MTEPRDPQAPGPPSLRQVIHAVTGDRDAEAEALRDRTYDAVADDDAKRAVQQAHGDRPGTTPSDREFATPADARAARDQQD